MAEMPAYVILGRGQWAQRMRTIIAAEGHHVSLIEETRQQQAEASEHYLERIASAIRRTGAGIAWICTAPGLHVTQMIEAALEAKAHVVVEKPWYGSEEESRRLQTLARSRRRIIAVHFEYLALQEVEECKSLLYPGDGCSFGGRYFLSRADHTGIPAIDNLGCHLFSIRQYVAPASTVSGMVCGYQQPDERLAWFDRGAERVATFDLLRHNQRIIQVFMKKVEAALDSAAFPFDLTFASRVAGELEEFKKRGSA